MPIAGFDPSLTHFGWVILDENKTGKDALIDTGTFKTIPSDGLLVQRILMQKYRMEKLLDQYKIDFVSMEAPYWGDYNTELLFALNQHIHEIFLDRSSFVVYFQPTVLKKHALPEMKANDVTKHHMTHQAKNELGKQGKRLSEHVADAYFAGKVGCRFYNWYISHKISDEDLNENEKHSFCGKHTFVRGTKKGLTEYNGIIYKENDLFFDYSKQKRKPKNIKKEILTNG